MPKPLSRPKSIRGRTAVEPRTPAIASPDVPLEIPETSTALVHQAEALRSRLPASAVYVGNNVNTAARFCRIIFESGNAGKGVRNAETVFLKVMRGFEIGIGPLEAQSELHAIDGKIGCSGKLLLKKIREAGVKHEWLESTDACARVRITLKNGETFEDEFTIEEAERAGLLDKQGSNYTRYPKRMLRWRALSFVVNGNVPELVGGGMLLAEELGAKIDPLTGAVLELPEQASARRPDVAAPAAPKPDGPVPGEDNGGEPAVKRVVQNDNAAPGVIGALRKYAIDAGLWDAEKAAVTLDAELAGAEGVELPGAGPYPPQLLAEQPNAGEIRGLLLKMANERKKNPVDSGSTKA